MTFFCKILNPHFKFMYKNLQVASLKGCWVQYILTFHRPSAPVKLNTLPGLQLFSATISAARLPISLLWVSAEELPCFFQCLFKIALQLHLQPTDYFCVLFVSIIERIIKTQLKHQQYYKNVKIQAPLSLICTNSFINENSFQHYSAHFHLIAG